MNRQKRFDIELQSYVFTSRFVIENNSPIRYVSHDADGDWQFLGGEDVREEDARVISLGEMIEHDSSILDLADLPLGKVARRKDRDSKWKTF